MGPSENDRGLHLCAAGDVRAAGNVHASGDVRAAGNVHASGDVRAAGDVHVGPWENDRGYTPRIRGRGSSGDVEE